MSKATPENSHNGTQEQKHQVGPWGAYIRLWAQASALELFIRSLAILSSAAGGVAYPLMAVIFGNLVNDFNDWGSGKLSPSEFRHHVSQNALWFVYLFIGKVVVSTHFVFRLKFISNLLEVFGEVTSVGR